MTSVLEEGWWGLMGECEGETFTEEIEKLKGSFKKKSSKDNLRSFVWAPTSFSSLRSLILEF